MPSVQSANKITHGCFGQIESTITMALFRDWQNLKSKVKKKLLKLPEQPVAIIKRCSMCQGLLLLACSLVHLMCAAL